ncbi:DUF6056 family protein [Helicobacter sp. 23-1044]
MFYLAFFIFSFFAGMASEQIGILVIIAIICLNALYGRRILRDSAKSLVFLNIALLFFVLGWLALYFSPGHAKRASLDVFDGVYMSLGQILALDFFALIKRVAQTAGAFRNDILLLFSIPLLWFLCFKKASVKNIALFALLVVILVVLNNNLKFGGMRVGFIAHLSVLFVALTLLCKRDGFFVAPLVLFVAFCLCMLSTIQFPALPPRARLGDSMIAIAMVAILFERFAGQNLQKIIVALCFGYAVFVSFAFIEYRIKWNNMLDFIAQSKQRGEMQIVIDDIFHSRYKNFMNWGNAGNNPNAWPNPSYAKYFGVESLCVRAKEGDCE